MWIGTTNFISQSMSTRLTQACYCAVIYVLFNTTPLLHTIIELILLYVTPDSTVMIFTDVRTFHAKDNTHQHLSLHILFKLSSCQWWHNVFGGITRIVRDLLQKGVVYLDEAKYNRKLNEKKQQVIALHVTDYCGYTELGLWARVLICSITFDQILFEPYYKPVQ